MTLPSVTYTGPEVGHIVAFIARAMSMLEGDDHEVADLLLDKALAVMPPLSPDLERDIAILRRPPVDRFWSRLKSTYAHSARFTVIDAALAGHERLSTAHRWLEELATREPTLQRLDVDHWTITPEAPDEVA